MFVCSPLFFFFPAAAFVEPVPVSFVLTTVVLGAVTCTELAPKESINQIQKREHSPGMGMTAETLVLPNFPWSFLISLRVHNIQSRTSSALSASESVLMNLRPKSLSYHLQKPHSSSMIAY